VALDMDPDAARPFIERAQPNHPSLIDEAHLVDERLGITNVPNGVWIDEHGMIVRPAEPAFPVRPNYLGARAQVSMPPRLAEMLEEAKKIRIEPEKYVAGVRDWVEHGRESRYALSPKEVLRRSGTRQVGEAMAAARFELGQHLHRIGRVDSAMAHFREAHRLQPDNWTYKRQAWSLADPLQGPTDLYDSDWLTDVRRIGAENYYPPLDMN
jgi:tetratricopeptide (TPR) repeat protein